MLREKQRVQIRPHMDAFMQGDRYGTIVKVGKQGAVSVKMDRSGKVRIFPADGVAPVRTAPPIPVTAVGRKVYYIALDGRKICAVVVSIDNERHPARLNLRITATKDRVYPKGKLVNTPPAFVQVR